MSTKTTSIVALGFGALLSACPGTLDEDSFYGRAPNASAASEGGVDPEESAEPEPRGEERWQRDAASALDAAAGEAGSPDASARWPELDGAPDAWSARTASDAAADAASAEAAVLADATAARDSGATTQEAGAGCDVRALFMQKCGNAGCHGAGAVASGLDLVSSDLATRLAGKKGSGACSSFALIDREAPERSALYVKVTAEACGSRMPLGGTLSDREQACILSWLENL